MKAIVNRTAPFVYPVELPLKVHCLFQMKLFNMPATYPVKLDKPSRHPKSFIITQITIIVIKVLLNPTTPYLIACLIVSILTYNLGNLLGCQFLDIRDRENIREEIAVLVTFIDHRSNVAFISVRTGIKNTSSTYCSPIVKRSISQSVFGR